MGKHPIKCLSQNSVSNPFHPRPEDAANQPTAHPLPLQRTSKPSIVSTRLAHVDSALHPMGGSWTPLHTKEDLTAPFVPRAPFVPFVPRAPCPPPWHLPGRRTSEVTETGGHELARLTSASVCERSCMAMGIWVQLDEERNAEASLGSRPMLA